MIVVADAGPLIHLSLIGRIDLLSSLYGRVLIPDLVYQEVVTAGEGLAGSSETASAAWIDIEPHDPGKGVWLSEELISRVLRDLGETG